MPTTAYVAAAIILLMLAFLNDYEARERRFLQRDDAVSLLIRRRLNKVQDLSLVYPLDIELELNKIEKYKKMQKDGANIKELQAAIEEDVELFFHEFPKRLEAVVGKHDPRNPMDVDPNRGEFERLIRGREPGPLGPSSPPTSRSTGTTWSRRNLIQAPMSPIRIPATPGRFPSRSLA